MNGYQDGNPSGMELAEAIGITKPERIITPYLTTNLFRNSRFSGVSLIQIYEKMCCIMSVYEAILQSVPFNL